MLKKQIIATVIVIVLYIGFGALYGVAKGPVESEIAVSQVEDTTENYVVGKAVATGVVNKTVNWLTGAVLLIIWLPILSCKKYACKPKTEGEVK